MSGAIANGIAAADDLEPAGIWKRGEDLPVACIHGHAGADVYIDKGAATGEAA